MAKEKLPELGKAIPASIIGEILPGGKGITVSDGGSEYNLEHPKVDPFWIRFEECLKKQSSEKLIP